ncbi:hypothetical protein NBRC116595_03580 [Aliiglaciecola sp. NS0011-25]
MEEDVNTNANDINSYLGVLNKYKGMKKYKENTQKQWRWRQRIQKITIIALGLTKLESSHVE